MKGKNETPVAILGGGISGLATAWYLHKANIPFTLFEKSTHTGGKIQSEIIEGTVFDFGPNTIRDKTGSIQQLAKELSLSDEIIKISEAFKTRYIVRDGRLCELSPSLKTIYNTPVLSTSGKLRALSEPFRKAKKSDNDESVGEFLERRIGKEAVEYLVDPVLSGIYAGDIYRMSKKSAFNKLADFEQEYGSIAWGAIRSKREKKTEKPAVISFKKGLQQLTDEITKQISASVLYEEVTGLKENEDGFTITCYGEEYDFDRVISCLPAYQLARILEGFDPEFSAVLNEIDYAPMLSTQVLYEQNDIATPKAGFGFLIPRKENLRLLGAIWKSELFPELTSPEKKHFTLMAGGAHDRNIITDSIEETEQQLLEEFSTLMDISEKPVVLRSKLWPKAIPQFEVGYAAVQSKITEVEKAHNNLHIGGNFRWGMAVPDCIEGAKDLVYSLL